MKRNKLIKTKALWMIYLIVFISLNLSISLSASDVGAEEGIEEGVKLTGAVVGGAAKVCCEKAKQGDFCRQTNSENECDRAYKIAYADCSATDFCRPVCCVDNIGGQCYKDVYKSKCQADTGEVFDDIMCSDVGMCEQGCCILGEQAFLSTQLECQKEIERLGASGSFGIEEVFDIGIKNEIECQQ